MKILILFALLAGVALIYLTPRSKGPPPPAVSATPNPNPSATSPAPSPLSRAPVKAVIVKQGQAPKPVPPVAPKYEDIRRANGFLPVPFRTSTAGGPVRKDPPLPGKVDAAVGQRITELPKGVVIQSKVKPIK